jgi:hypothetical protein
MRPETLSSVAIFAYVDPPICDIKNAVRTFSVAPATWHPPARRFQTIAQCSAETTVGTGCAANVSSQTRSIFFAPQVDTHALSHRTKVGARTGKSIKVSRFDEQAQEDVLREIGGIAGIPEASSEQRVPLYARKTAA